MIKDVFPNISCKYIQKNISEIAYVPPLVVNKERMMEKFFPVNILNKNISSNPGLEIIMEKIVLQFIKYNPHRYILLTVDINIFVRVCKVLF